MPLEKSEFLKGKAESCAVSISKILEVGKDHSFTTIELSERTGFHHMSVYQVLRKLEKKGRIESRMIGVKKYYCWKGVVDNGEEETAEPEA